MSELLVGHTTLRGLKRSRQMLFALVRLPTIDTLRKHLVELSIPPFRGLFIGEVDMLADAFPPLVGFAVINTIVLCHHLVIGGTLLLRRIFTLFVHTACEPKNGSHTFLREALDHRCRVAIALRVPREVVIGRRPRTVDDNAVHRNLSFQIALHQLRRSLRGVQTVFPHDMSQGPGWCDGRAFDGLGVCGRLCLSRCSKGHHQE